MGTDLCGKPLLSVALVVEARKVDVVVDVLGGAVPRFVDGGVVPVLEDGRGAPKVECVVWPASCGVGGDLCGEGVEEA